MEAILILKKLKQEKEKFSKLDISIHSKKILEKEIENISKSIDELKELENRSCESCSTEYKGCSLYIGANQLISLKPDRYSCSLWECKK